MNLGIGKKIADMFGLFAKAEQARAKLPLHLRPEIDEIAKTLPQYGPHKLRKKGPGSEFFDMHEHVDGVDDRRRIHAGHSKRLGKEMSIDNQAEIRHPFYMWCDSSLSMDWESNKVADTPREAAIIMMMAWAKYLTKHNERIGMLETGAATQSRNSPEWIATQLQIDQARGHTGRDVPQIQALLPRDSTALILSDFLWNLESEPEILPAFTRTLKHLQTRGITGHLIMMADPEIFDFGFSKNSVFEGLEGEAEFTDDLGDGQDYRKKYHKALLERIELVQGLAAQHRFKFTIQRTDKPLSEGLLALFEKNPKMPAYVQQLKM